MKLDRSATIRDAGLHVVKTIAGDLEPITQLASFVYSSDPLADTVSAIRRLSSLHPTTEQSWNVRPLHNDDLQGVAELARIVYGEDALTDVSYLDWKYYRNPSGKTIGVVCECQDRIVGFNAIIPQVFKIGSSTWRVGWGGDLMVHPEFRRQGMFVALVRSNLEWAALTGTPKDVAFVYGTRDLKSPTIRGLLKYFEYSNPGRLTVLRKYLRVLSSIEALSVFPAPTPKGLMRYVGSLTELVSSVVIGNLSSWITHSMERIAHSQAGEMIQVRKMDRLVFGEEFDRLWEEVKDTLPVAVVKNMAYLNWRYANPAAHYVGFRADDRGVLRGYAVLAYMVEGKLKTGSVMDLLAANSELAAKLVEECMRCAEQDQAHIFKMWETKETKTFAKQLGLRKTRRKQPLVMRVFDPKLPLDLVGSLANWCVNFGDTEDWV
jgi:GNAT superfamily N-acetyltransferase